jgi:hypothetical protein
LERESVRLVSLPVSSSAARLSGLYASTGAGGVSALGELPRALVLPNSSLARRPKCTVSPKGNPLEIVTLWTVPTVSGSGRPSTGVASAQLVLSSIGPSVL